MKYQILLACGLAVAAPAATSYAGVFESVGPAGFWHSPAAWVLVEGTDEGGDGIPSAGDDVVVLAGHLIEMHEPHEADDVTVHGRLQGSTNAAEFDLTHTLGSVTVKPGGEFDLADGREAETVIINITGDLVLEAGSLIKAASFGDLSDITLNLGGNLTDANETAFAIYGGASTSWDLVFTGTDPATISMVPGASRNFANIIIPNEKTVTVDSTHPIWIDANNTVTVQTGATLMLENGAFFFGPGYFTLEVGATFGVAAGHGVLRSALFQNSGTTTLPNEVNYVFYGIEGQDTGADLPTAVNSLTIDTPDWVTLSQSVNVNGPLNLVSGRLETDVHTVFAGETEDKVVVTSGYVDGNLARTFDAATVGPRLFPVGTETRYLPVTIDITAAGSGFGFLTVSAVDGALTPAPDDPALPFYWNIDGGAFGGYSASLIFGYPDADAPAEESAIRMARYDGSAFEILPGQSVNTATNQVSVPGVTAFSSWVPVVSASSVSDWTVY